MCRIACSITNISSITFKIKRSRGAATVAKPIAQPSMLHDIF